MDPYKILNISKGASPEEIRKAYRKAASKHHPDKGGELWVFQQVQQAYESLTQPKVPKKKKQPPASQAANKANATSPKPKARPQPGPAEQVPRRKPRPTNQAPLPRSRTTQEGRSGKKVGANRTYAIIGSISAVVFAFVLFSSQHFGNRGTQPVGMLKKSSLGEVKLGTVGVRASKNSIAASSPRSSNTGKGIKWVSNLDNAKAISKEDGRPVLLLLTDSGKVPDDPQKAHGFGGFLSDFTVVERSSEFIWVKRNLTSELKKQFDLRGSLHYLVLNSKDEIIFHFSGQMNPERFVKYLDSALSRYKARDAAR